MNKCVIFAAGKGTRMLPLTENTPKPMLKVLDKPLLGRILMSLPHQIDEVVLVVGYLGDNIKNYFGPRFDRFKIDYVVQKEQLGTYHALETCRPFLKDGDRFLVMFADDLHGREGLEECVGQPDFCILVNETDEPEKFGIVELSPDGHIIGIDEKPARVDAKSNLASTGVMVLSTDVFKYPAPPKIDKGKTEYFLPDSVAQMMAAGHKFRPIRATMWIPIGYPKDLVEAERILSSIESI